MAANGDNGRVSSQSVKVRTCVPTSRARSKQTSAGAAIRVSITIVVIASSSVRLAACVMPRL